DAEHVGRQHVAGELNALELDVKRPGQRVGQRGLAHAGNAFDQKMATGQHCNQGQAYYLVITADDVTQGLFDRRCPRADGRLKLTECHVRCWALLYRGQPRRQYECKSAISMHDFAGNCVESNWKEAISSQHSAFSHKTASGLSALCR